MFEDSWWYTNNGDFRMSLLETAVPVIKEHSRSLLHVKISVPKTMLFVISFSRGKQESDKAKYKNIFEQSSLSRTNLILK